MSKMIITIYDDKSQTETKVVGVPGKSCHAASAAYEDVLGGRVTSSKATAEMLLPERKAVAKSAARKK